MRRKALKFIETEEITSRTMGNSTVPAHVPRTAPGAAQGLRTQPRHSPFCEALLASLLPGYSRRVRVPRADTPGKNKTYRDIPETCRLKARDLSIGTEPRWTCTELASRAGPACPVLRTRTRYTLLGGARESRQLNPGKRIRSGERGSRTLAITFQ